MFVLLITKGTEISLSVSLFLTEVNEILRYRDILQQFVLYYLAYSNDDNSATVSKLTAQGSHDRQANELPVVAALVLSGL